MAGTTASLGILPEYTYPYDFLFFTKLTNLPPALTMGYGMRFGQSLRCIRGSLPLQNFRSGCGA